MPVNEKKVLSYLGFAKKGGRLISGMNLVEKAVKSGEARLVIVSVDASDNTSKRINDKCSFYNVPCKCLSDMDTLGHAIGSDYRAVVACTDDGLAKAILNCFNDGGYNISE